MYPCRWGRPRRDRALRSGPWKSRNSDKFCGNCGRLLPSLRTYAISCRRIPRRRRRHQGCWGRSRPRLNAWCCTKVDSLLKGDGTSITHSRPRAQLVTFQAAEERNRVSGTL